MLVMVAVDEGNAATPPLLPQRRGYVVTGRAAHGRVGRLFRSLIKEREEHGAAAPEQPRQRRREQHWVDASPYAENSSRSSSSVDSKPAAPVAFLWENAPRNETRSVRDGVRCYSHLPHGIILDDKWALARLLGRRRPWRSEDVGGENIASGNCDEITEDPDLVVLDSHCFRGAEFAAFAGRVGLLPSDVDNCSVVEASSPTRDSHCRGDAATAPASNCEFEDLLLPRTSSSPPPPPRNLWVVKDAMSNGAGGIWIVDPSNAREFLDDDDPSSSPSSSTPSAASAAPSSALHPAHRYVAQRYAWPPTLFGGRKCHVRVYGLITGDGRAFVHRRAFLHVANELFHHNDDVMADGEDGGDGEGKERFEAAVHITNCCANSHDPHKFAGEICVDLELPGPFSIQNDATEGNNDRVENRGDNSNLDGEILLLGDYLPSVSASVAALARRSAPFVRGGEANGGFEYLGLDFVLSSVEEGQWRRPVAYLLEVNAPPSQDTATGLAHAEGLHDEVISDLLRMWVLPRLDASATTLVDCNGGWSCVYAPPGANEYDVANGINLIVPSKAAILNRIRWAMFERRALKEEELLRRSEGEQLVSPGALSKDEEESKNDEQTSSNVNNGGLDTNEQKNFECESRKGQGDTSFDPDAFVAFVRSQFPYFNESKSGMLPEQRTTYNDIFFESGGGAQVPKLVSDAFAASLSRRDRSVVGASQQRGARAAIASLLVAAPREGDRRRQDGDSHVVAMGSNATSLLDLLARKILNSGGVGEGDEIVIASENHLANVTPWLEVAGAAGATVGWWTVTDKNERKSDGSNATDDNDQPTESCILSDLINENTKVVAISHASNILGTERDVLSVCELVRRVTRNRGQVVVDGVAVAPHLLSPRCNVAGGPDWYVVSLHKLFGPHLGCLVGKRSRAVQLYSPGATVCAEESLLSDEALCKSWEMGTMNYEACCGAVGLKAYFDALAIHAQEMFGLGREDVANSATDDGVYQTSNQITSETSNDHLGGDGGSQSQEGGPVASDASADLNVARTCIRRVEDRLLRRLLGHLQNCAPLVRVVQDEGRMKVSHEADVVQRSLVGDDALWRIPIVCFVHANMPSRDIVRHCRSHGVECRAGNFLSTERLREELGVEDDGVIRFSLAHYNTLEEIDRSIAVLEMLDGWS